MDLSGKVILITGAGSGIGRSSSLICAGYGAAIAALDINEAAAQKTADMIAEKGGKAIALKADITKREQVAEAVKKTVEAFGTIDVLFNNAGTTKLGTLTELDDATFDFIINLNLKGCFIVTTEVLKVMIPNRKGRIINTTSYCAVRGEYANGPYCASKAGIALLTQVMALELGQYNINAVAIAPGNMDTELLQSAFEKRSKIEGISIDEMYAEAGKKVPLGRVGKPEEIAEMVAFLSSDASYYVNGSNLLVTGGYVMS